MVVPKSIINFAFSMEKSIKQLFEDYKPIELKIWRTFTDTTVGNLIKE